MRELSLFVNVSSSQSDPSYVSNHRFNRDIVMRRDVSAGKSTRASELSAAYQFHQD